MLVATVLTNFAIGPSSASNAMKEQVAPIMTALIAIAGIVAVVLLIWGGIRYASSNGKPDQLEDAKKIIRNTLIGLVVILAMSAITALLVNAYSGHTPTGTEGMPQLQEVKADNDTGGVTEVLIKGVTGLLKTIIESIGQPFMDALGYFTNSTPLVAQNSTVFRMWFAIVAIANVLFALMGILLGFHIMSAAALGLDELEFKHMLPQLVFIFLMMNCSIFAIDAVITLSNGMIYAFQSAFPSTSIWLTLSGVVDRADGLGVAALLLMLVFIVLSVMLLVYYVMRLITLYIGAILSPLIMLLWLLPAFRDFAVTAIKVYLTTIFVLFVHVVIILLASSMLSGALPGGNGGEPNTIMAMILGAAAVVALLKTQGLMQQMSYVSTGPRALRKLGTQFVSGAGDLSRSIKKSSIWIKEKIPSKAKADPGDKK